MTASRCASVQQAPKWQKSSFEPNFNFLDSGTDIIEDFVRTEDKITFSTLFGDVRDFSDLDSNGNRRLDDADRYVRVENFTYHDVTKLSTIIDLSANEG